MIRCGLALTVVVGVVLAPSASQACTPILLIKPDGEAYPLSSPLGWAEQQTRWRTEAEAIYLAQVSGARLAGQNEVVFTLTPVRTIYDDPVPDTDVVEVRDRGQTCTSVRLALGDHVVVYADYDRRFGWSVLGIASLEQVQDRPANFPTERDIARGLIPSPVYPD